MSTRIKRLTFEMLYCKAKSKNHSFRKLSFFFQNPADPKVQFDANTHKSSTTPDLKYQLPNVRT